MLIKFDDKKYGWLRFEKILKITITPLTVVKIIEVW